jgi:hypothetical protein
MKIRIYLDRPLYQSLQEYYERAKELKEKIKRLEALIQEKQLELQKLELESKENTELLFQLIKSESSGWYRRFGWSFTSLGKLVIIGRSADMNEVIIKRYTKPEYWVFHADIVGAGFVVLQSTEINEKEIYELARLAASYSKAWKSGIYAVDVFYVKAFQLSKAAPSGEYIKKGAFMIYGERNWVKNAELKICFGINLEHPSFFVGGSDEACMRFTSKYWVLIPSEPSKERDYQRLLKELRKLTGLSKQSLVKFVNKYLPGKNIRILGSSEGSSEPLPSVER